MTQQRPRRIVRRAVTALAGIVLLVSLYIAHAAAFVFGVQAGWISPATRDLVLPVFSPLDFYVVNHLPGSGFIVDTMNVAGKAGNDFGH